MQIEANAEVTCSSATGRLVFNSKAIEAFGLSPEGTGAARVPARW